MSLTVANSVPESRLTRKQIFQAAAIGVGAALLLALGAGGAFVLIVLPGIQEERKVEQAKAMIDTTGMGLDAFEIDTGRFPTTGEGLKAMTVKPVGLDGWKGAYLKVVPDKDPWNGGYEYRCPGGHNTSTYDISSAGPNGKKGDADDLKNW